MLSEKIQPLTAKKILIVAHGNIINAIGLKLLAYADVLSSIYFNYCEGFEILEDKLTIL